MGDTEELSLTPDQLMLIAIFGLVAIVGLFCLTALVRRWGLQMQKPHPTGGLDITELKRQLLAGVITPEEYETISRRLARTEGEGNPSVALPPRSITNKEPPTGGPPAGQAGQEGSPEHE
jgi:hypothetical protein